MQLRQKLIQTEICISSRCIFDKTTLKQNENQSKLSPKLDQQTFSHKTPSNFTQAIKFNANPTSNFTFIESKLLIKQHKFLFLHRHSS